MFYYMHNNNNYQCKMCWNKALIFGVSLIKLSFHIIVFTSQLCGLSARLFERTGNMNFLGRIPYVHMGLRLLWQGNANQQTCELSFLFSGEKGYLGGI